MISINDFMDSEGRIDWRSYKQAQIDNGENCYKCKAPIILGNGSRTTCSACDSIYGSSAVSHHSLIRCPFCCNQMDVHDDLWYLFEEGEHTVSCTVCEKDFTVKTEVKYLFESPSIQMGSEEDND